MPSRAARVSFALSVCVAASFPAIAWGQLRPSLDVRTFRPSTDPAASLVLEPVTTPGPWQWNVGAWVHYAQRPVVASAAISGGSETSPIAHAFGTDFVAGIGLGERAAIGVDLPVFWWQDGTTSLSPTIVTAGRVPTTGLGDLAVQGKATIVTNDRQGVKVGFGLAALAAVTLPTGDRRGFQGEGAVTSSLSVLGEYALGVAAVRAAIGYKVRTERRTWPDDAGAGGVPFGDEIPWSFAITLQPKAVFSVLDTGDRQIWELGLHGTLPAGPVAPFGLGSGHNAASASELSPALIAADDRVALGSNRDAYGLVGVDVGLDRAIGTPDFRAVVALGWAPRAHDRDGDGVPDDVDECPDLPEDRDGIQDNDGCPEDDADGDGVPDVQDACPLVPGVPQADPHANGCPEAKK